MVKAEIPIPTYFFIQMSDYELQGNRFCAVSLFYCIHAVLSCYNTDNGRIRRFMESKDLIPYKNKFISVTLDDGTVVSGYVSNPEDFSSGEEDESGRKILLLNGLLHSEILISRIVNITMPDREETIHIPVVNTDGVTIVPKKTLDEQLDDLFRQSLSDEIVVTLPDGRRIRKINENEE